jgi:hypothetical protein
MKCKKVWTNSIMVLINTKLEFGVDRFNNFLYHINVNNVCPPLATKKLTARK